MYHEFLQKNPGKVATKFNFNTPFQKLGYRCKCYCSFKSCGVYQLFNPNVFQMLQASESSSSVRSSLQSIETSPADESDTRLITQMDNVTDNSGFSAAQEELCQRKAVIFY